MITIHLSPVEQAALVAVVAFVWTLAFMGALALLGWNARRCRTKSEQFEQSEMNILNLKMAPNDANAKTIREYLRSLLSTLWVEDEGFSGKRPFGNSGWKYEVYEAMVKAGAVSGRIDGEGYLEHVDREAADQMILDAITKLK
jgi:hypothetical protein